MRRPKTRRSIRARMLAIVLVPSAALLIVGVGGAGYLVYQGHKAEEWATDKVQSAAVDLATEFTAGLAGERRLSLLRLGDDSVASELTKQRGAVDATVIKVKASQSTDPMTKDMLGQLPQFRHDIDAGATSPQRVYEYYNHLIDMASMTLQGVALSAPDPVTAYHGAMAVDLFQVAESMSRANALAEGGVAKGGMDDWAFQQFSQQVGSYHAMLDMMMHHMSQSQMDAHHMLIMSPQWQKLTEVESYLLLHGPGTGASGLPGTVAQWQQAATKVHAQLLTFYTDHNRYAAGFAADTGHRTFVNSLLGGGVILLFTLIAAFVAIRLSNRVVDRLKSLRENTLALADTRLPQTVMRLRRGEQIDVEAEVPPLQYGDDEIGQVAEAFNKAQRTAVAAAAQEAEIQNGVRSVFLNIAHRSQVVVHRQLAVLDKAERAQEHPEHLELLFQLDHLATRARRNAENLLILGGDQPGRQWRHPVRLVEIVRSAVGETEHYRRVSTGRLPAVRMAGSAVADLIHLLAELVDNATSFSPPQSRVEVRGNLVGKGLVVEVEDQGIGLSPEQLARMNEFLRDPPDFGLMSLSEDARLGLFVVSQLAARHGIRVTLVESAYGGVRAIMLVPAAFIADDLDEPVALPAPAAKQVVTAAPDRTRTLTAATNGSGPAWPSAEASAAAEARTETATMAQTARARRATTAPPSTNGDGPGRPDGHPALPRRRRQANLAPQLAEDRAAPAEQTATSMSLGDMDAVRSAERARNRMLAFRRGTRNGRAGHDPNEL